jgi:LacI family transcriptional regulator
VDKAVMSLDEGEVAFTRRPTTIDPKLARQLIGLPKPLGVFACHDRLGLLILQELRRAGARVPEEIALVGFDDLPPALVMFPFLTVAAQPAYEMGRRAAALLIDRLEGRLASACEEIVLPTELIVRVSSGVHLSHPPTPSLPFRGEKG